MFISTTQDVFNNKIIEILLPFIFCNLNYNKDEIKVINVLLKKLNYKILFKND